MGQSHLASMFIVACLAGVMTTQFTAGPFVARKPAVPTMSGSPNHQSAMTKSKQFCPQTAAILGKWSKPVGCPNGKWSGSASGS